MSKTDDYIQQLVDATQKSKSQWLTEQLGKLLPPEVFALSLSAKPSDRMKLARYLAVNKIRTIEYPSRPAKMPEGWNGDWKAVPKEDLADSYSQSELWQGDTKVSTFRIRLHGTKVEIMSRDMKK